MSKLCPCGAPESCPYRDVEVPAGLTFTGSKHYPWPFLGRDAVVMWTILLIATWRLGLVGLVLAIALQGFYAYHRTRAWWASATPRMRGAE